MNNYAVNRLKGLFKFGRALRFVWEGSPGWTVVNAFFVLIQGILPLAQLYFLKKLINSVAAAARHHGNTPVIHHVILIVICYAISSIASTLFSNLSAAVSERQAAEVTDKMQGVLHQRSVAADLEYYENSQYYDTLHRAQMEAPSRPTRIVNSLVQISQSVIMLAAIAAYLLVSIHWQFALLILAVALPGIVIKLMFANRMFEWQRRSTSVQRRVGYYDYMLSSDVYAKELRLFDLGKFLMDRVHILRNDLRKQRLRISGQRAMTDAFAQTLSSSVIYFTFGSLAVSAALGMLSVGSLVMFLQAFQRAMNALQTLLAGIADLYENSLFLNHLYEFLDLKPKLVEAEVPVATHHPIRQGIRVDHVSFQYANTDKMVLKDVSFEIPAGKTVALVGENGSGKTTLIKLLCRLYDPTSGTISIDGTPLPDFATQDLRRQYSVVFQDYCHYAMSLKDNIRLGDTTLSQDDEMIEIAAKRAGADDIAQRLPEGYETTVGYAFDSGVELSIGQWQKVALARAFVRNAQIVILDEPTSALDATAEQEVFEAFRHLAAGRTAVLISHRLSTVRMADMIVVLDGGRIVEQGTHEELVRLDGAYARLFETQAKSYVGAFDKHG